MRPTRSLHEVTMRFVRSLLVAGTVALLTGCQDAAPAPCLIQRPPLGGYTLKLTLQGTPPAGCEDVLPPIFGDNWRIDKYIDDAVYMKSDLMPWPPEGGDPDHPVLGVGTLGEEPVDGICTIPDVSEMRSDTDPLGIGEPTLAYHAHEMRFLSGARYQGAEFEATVEVTLGSCSATYYAHALTPSQLGGTCLTDDDCSPFADPENGRPLGSGINSDFAVACTKESWVIDFLTGDPDVGICFFTEPFPGLK